MRIFLPFLVAMLVLASNGCRRSDGNETPAAPASGDPVQLDAFIRHKAAEAGEFRWSWASDDQVWTALAHSDYVMSVGFQPAGETNVESRLHLIDLKAPEWVEARAAVMALILENERALRPELTEADLIAFPEFVLPVVDVYVRNPTTVAALRQSGFVRYAEPMGYEPGVIDRSGSGCDSNTPANGLVAGTDYTNIAPGCKSSWNHPFHNLSGAWNTSSGSGIQVMIVDTGCSPDQDNLGENFNQGYSSGRDIQKLVTLPQATFLGIPIGPVETPDDGCGHGTSMLGACGGPRGEDGAATGVAYNCDLISVRAAADVYLNESREVKGASDAFTLAGNTASVKIVSMSMGRILTASQLSDAIKYAYNNGKLIFCAAGTSFSWSSGFGVIFPATMAEAVAITGIKTNLTQKCAACHEGSKVDFVVVMEKSGGGALHPLSLAMEGDDPSTVGGSSVSTASTAGIAALVWAAHPGWTRQQVFDRLKTSANYWPSRHPKFGWGRINADVAVD